MRSMGITMVLAALLLAQTGCGKSYEEENKALKKQIEILKKEARRQKLEAARLKEELKTARKAMERLRTQLAEKEEALQRAMASAETGEVKKVKEVPKGLEGFKTILKGSTAKRLAGDRCKSPDTIYIKPDGGVLTGQQITDCESLPLHTTILLGYKGPFKITRNKTAYRIAGPRYKDKETLYYLPGKGIKRGDQLDFKSLPPNTLVFLKAR